jgi:hypothetical protein
MSIVFPVHLFVKRITILNYIYYNCIVYKDDSIEKYLLEKNIHKTIAKKILYNNYYY